MLMYGSSLRMLTGTPRALRMRPMLAAVMPLPSELVTPPVTNTYLGIGEVLRVRLGVAEGATREQKRRGVCSGRNHSASSHRIGMDRAAPAAFIPEERSMRRSLAAFVAAGAIAVFV